MDALSHTTRPIRITERHACCDKLLAHSSFIPGFCVRDGTLDRSRLLLCAYGSDPTIVEHSICGARNDERFGKLSL